MKYYDEYKNLVTVSNSLLKYYGCETFHETCKELDEILAKTNKKVCAILLDGFGTLIQERHQEYCPFILGHKRIQITSVFPPTTAAATTALLTGKYPIETGWLGWNQKFEMWDEMVTMFRSAYVSNYNNKTPIAIDDLIQNEMIDSMIKKNNPDKKINTFKSLDLEDRSVEAFFKETNKIVKDSDFLYAYLTDPDHTLHIYGEKSPEVIDVIKRIDKELEKIVNDNKDTLFITLADHGHILAEYLDIREHADFMATLKYPFFALEQRACVFYVEDENKEEFKKLATKYYGKYFDIYNKKEINDMKLFGKGKPHKFYNECSGDFILIANTNKCLAQEYSPDLKSQHAGGTDIEKYINLGIYNE